MKQWHGSKSQRTFLQMYREHLLVFILVFILRLEPI